MSKTILITGAAKLALVKLQHLNWQKEGIKVIATTQVYPQMSDLIREAGEKEIDLIVDKLDVTNPRDIAYAHKK